MITADLSDLGLHRPGTTSTRRRGTCP